MLRIDSEQKAAAGGGVIVVLFCLVLAVPAAAPARGFGPYRLIDQARPPAASIGGVRKHALDPRPVEHRFPLRDAPAGGAIHFATGFAPRTEAARVRFTILLVPRSGEPETLFEKERSEAGWEEERIELGARELDGAELVFRRTLVRGRVPDLLNGFWGNPMVRPAERAARPSVVVVSLDTLRADRIGVYGHAGARTPVLGSLARNGVWYDHAYSPSTWTVPSHTALFNGLHARVGGAAPTPPPGDLPAGAPERPIAEILHAAGYLTAGFTGGGYLSWQFGFARGFETYYEFEQPKREAGCAPERFDGDEVFGKATRWLRAHHASPFFLFVHTYDVHDRCPFIPADAPVFTGWPTLTPERRRELLDYYDDLIARTDRRLGALLSTLDELGLTRDTLVIVTSDHGEAFSEHGERGHGCDTKPYEELTRVPLVVRFPGRVPAGRRVSTPVSLIDVAPTMLALMRLPQEPWMRGGILPGLDLPGARAQRPVHVHCGDVLAVRQGPYKLITSRTGAFPDELYDLERDPRERRNLTGDRPEAHAELRHAATDFWTSAGPAAAATPKVTDIDESTRERLRALGYLE